MVLTSNDTGNKPPITPVKRGFRVGTEEYTTCAGLHLFYAPTKSGKSLLTCALAMAIDQNANWLYINEPGGLFVEDAEVEALVLKSPRDYVFVDSITTYLMSLQASGDSPAMSGGMTMGLAKGVARFDKKAREAGKVVVATVNSSLMSVPLKDAMVHGQLRGMLATAQIVWHDRASGRIERTIELEDSHIAAACEKLNYTGGQAFKKAPKDEVDKEVGHPMTRQIVFKHKDV